MWYKSVGNSEGWYGFPPKVPGLQPSGDAAAEAGRKKFPWKT